MDDKRALTEIEDDDIYQLVKGCEEEFLESFKLTPQEIHRLKKDLKRKVLSSTFSVPMICRGPDCPMAKTCPLLKLDKFPIGEQCPIELLLMRKWKDEYVESLKIDWNDAIERKMIIELVELDVLSSRANSVLSDEGFIMENAVGVNEQTGEIAYRREEHVALKLKEVVYNRRSKLLKEMAATREAKLKFLTEQKGDPSQYASKLRKKAEELRMKHEETIIDAESITEEESNENQQQERE